MDFPKALETAKGLSDLFELVKEGVRVATGRFRGGLMLGLADLGNHPQGFLGAFYPMTSNVIVMNRIPLMRIKETNPTLFKPYAFHVLLHEYLHTLGYVEEMVVRPKAYEITRALFGETHVATQVAENPMRFFPSLVYPDLAWQPESLNLELVPDFDRGNTSYIA